MDSRLQELLDHHDIRKSLAEYCHACDRLDQVRLENIYLEDSWDDHGAHKCAGREFARLATSLLATGTEMCSHQLGQSLITLSGDKAGAETYFIVSRRRKDDDDQELLEQMGGRYVDRLRRTSKGWKIEHRICIREWSITHLVTEDWAAEAGFANGLRTGADPALAVLGFEHSGVS